MQPHTGQWVRQESLEAESTGSETKQVRTPAPHQICCVTMAMLINLSGPQFPHSQNGLIMAPSAQGLTQRLAHKECHHPGSPP